MLFVASLLLSCSNSDEAIKTHNNVMKLKVNLTKNMTKTTLFNFPQPVSVTYQASKLRSPFEKTQLLETAKNNNTRPLTHYPISMLKLVGTLSKDNKQFAYLLTPENKVYPIEIGESIGDHGGKVINIYPDHVDILEQEIDSNKSIKQHTIVLRLKEENK